MSRILLTGATSGIGLAAAARLAEQPHDLVIHGPEPEQAAGNVLAAVGRAAHPRTTITYIAADFTRMESVQQLADAVMAGSDRLDVLVNNAAIPGPASLTMGSVGTEITYQVNYLAGTLLTHLLLPSLGSHGRVVNVGSATHFSATLDVHDLDFHDRPYSPSAAYAQSKLAIVTYSNWLATRVALTVVSLHPGVVSTTLLHAMFSIGGVPPAAGGDNLVHAITADLATGSYLDESTPGAPSAPSLDASFQAALVEDAQTRLSTTLP